MNSEDQKKNSLENLKAQYGSVDTNTSNPTTTTATTTTTTNTATTTPSVPITTDQVYSQHQYQQYYNQYASQGVQYNYGGNPITYGGQFQQYNPYYQYYGQQAAQQQNYYNNYYAQANQGAAAGGYYGGNYATPQMKQGMPNYGQTSQLINKPSPANSTTAASTGLSAINQTLQNQSKIIDTNKISSQPEQTYHDPLLDEIKRTVLNDQMMNRKSRWSQEIVVPHDIFDQFDVKADKKKFDFDLQNLLNDYQKQHFNQYIRKCFDKCQNAKEQQLMSSMLMTNLSTLIYKKMLDTIKWDTYYMPLLPREKDKPAPIVHPYAFSAQQVTSTNSAPPATPLNSSVSTNSNSLSIPGLAIPGLGSFLDQPQQQNQQQQQQQSQFLNKDSFQQQSVLKNPQTTSNTLPFSINTQPSTSINQLYNHNNNHLYNKYPPQQQQQQSQLSQQQFHSYPNYNNNNNNNNNQYGKNIKNSEDYSFNLNNAYNNHHNNNSNKNSVNDNKSLNLKRHNEIDLQDSLRTPKDTKKQQKIENKQKQLLLTSQNNNNNQQQNNPPLQLSLANADTDSDLEYLVTKWNIVGTCTDIEKPYLRLTKEPSPDQVRPEEVLKQALKFLMNKWKNRDCEYSYIQSQFRSIRQDLIIQHIHNEFTAKVCEYNARICLEVDDMGQYVQCCATLFDLYNLGLQGKKEEFYCYKIIDQGLDNKSALELPKLINEVSSFIDHPFIQFAIDLIQSHDTGNVYKFFQLYSKAPNMCQCIIERNMMKYRLWGLIIISKSYSNKMQLEDLCNLLKFDDIHHTRDFITSTGGVLDESGKEILLKESFKGFYESYSMML